MLACARSGPVQSAVFIDFVAEALDCARIWSIYSAVFSEFIAEALSGRIADLFSSVVVVAHSGGCRRNQVA